MAEMTIETYSNLRTVEGVPLLTTVFTPGAWCASRWVASSTVVFGHSIGFNSAVGNAMNSEYFDLCSPFSQRAREYSPGVCPSGQEVQRISEYRDGSKRLWRGHCCSSWMRHGEEIPHLCEATITTPFTAIAALTESDTTYWDYTTTIDGGPGVPNLVTSLQNKTLITDGTARSSPMTVYWESADLSRFPPAYASSLATKIGVAFPETTSPSPGASNNIVSSTSSPQPSPTPVPSALSNSAKTGIGVGSAVGALALIAIVLGIWWTRRRRRSKNANPQVSEMPDSSNRWSNLLRGKWRAEVDGNASQRPVEVAGDELRAPAEVDGEDTQRPAEVDAKSVKVVPGPPVELQ